MNNRDSGVWLVPAFAVLALFFPLSAGLQAPPARPAAAQGEPAGGTNGEKGAEAKGDEEKAPSGKGREGEHGAAQLIREFLGVCKDGRLLRGREDPRTEVELGFLIATVPDPIDSRFDYLFDRHLDAAQRALESAGYVLDRF